ncbi:hypothetical protein RISK_005414 [Rhodopirellula islandica]|uniref:Transmembrane protein n=1 Tax=Rhodopirellula islandica TaxID=595434 RepID=A0A0J1B6X9_RHOIS|nr:hypothetical protein [Rhodopirellula islandica]KLU02348.1 hypothetical protein RISK_005414 [Rhodopirellula islandica]
MDPELNSPYTPPLTTDSVAPSRFRRLARWRTIPVVVFGLGGLAGIASGLWLTAYFWYTAFAWDAPLIYPDNYRALVRWPIFTVLSVICFWGAIKIWRGGFKVGLLASIGAYCAARLVFILINDLW